MLILDACKPQFPIIFCNAAFERISGYRAAELTGKTVKLLNGPETDRRAVEHLEEMPAQGWDVTETLVHYRKDGASFRDRVVATCIRDQQGKTTHVVCVFSEANDHRIAEEERKRLNAERQAEALRSDVDALNARLYHAMTETHHRVKNSLQVLLAMLDMQVMANREMAPIAEIVRMEMHIHTLAGIHDILTRQAKVDRQALDLSATEVLESLLPLMQQTSRTRRLTFHLEEIRLPTQQATSLAFVANELVGNALKFGRSEATLRLHIDAKGKRVILSVCDDGPGFPADFDPKLHARTGLELVEHLTYWDLRGSTRYETLPGGGACAAVTLPIP